MGLGWGWVRIWLGWVRLGWDGDGDGLGSGGVA